MEALTKKILMGLGVAILMLFGLNRMFFFSPGFLEKISTVITYPIVKCSSAISNHLKASCKRKENYVELEQKYANIKQAYLNVLAENMQLKAIIHYDNLSKELRDFQQRYNLSNMILAKILVKNITDDEHYFLVNKGFDDGIRKNMTAVYKFQLIGKVTEVFSNYSKVLLITDQMCKVAAYTNQTSSQGIVRGQNCIDRCTMNYVSHLFKIVDQDLIISSGKGLVFPEGFCLGKIVYHEIKEKSLYHDIEVEPLVNIQALEYCLLTDHTGLHSAAKHELTQEPQQAPIIHLTVPQNQTPKTNPLPPTAKPITEPQKPENIITNQQPNDQEQEKETVSQPNTDQTPPTPEPQQTQPDNDNEKP